MAAPKDYSKLRDLLLAQETFPLDYLHKFVGRNTSAFDADVLQWKARFTPLACQSDRLSANQKHRSLTFVLRMQSVDELIEMLRATDKIADLVLVL